MRYQSNGGSWPGFKEIVRLPLLYLVAPAKDEQEATEAARIVAFTAYGKVITGTSRGSMSTAHRMNRDFELQTDDSHWEHLFQKHLRDEPATVLVVPADVIEQISGLKPETGSVIAVFEHNGTLVFEQFN